MKATHHHQGRACCIVREFPSTGGTMGATALIEYRDGTLTIVRTRTLFATAKTMHRAAQREAAILAMENAQ